jgi:Tfp pilus assembly protein PilF
MTTSSEGTPLQTMRASEFVRRMKGWANEQDRHYVMWLGAGCSVSSGIPAASALVREHWLPELHRLRTGGSDELDDWTRQEFPDYDSNNAGASYGVVMHEVFRLPEDRQRETERLCSGREPGFGYAVLAALMSRDDGLLSTTLTTNFDDMIADAMYVYGDRRPLVIEHDTLAGFARPGRVRRPLVVKVHGDHRLNPMHTREETAELTASVAVGIRGLLQDRGVIFVGYSGSDVGVLEALRALPKGALPNGVWWVSRNEPTGDMRAWLVSREATWVQAGTFDKLMLLFHQEFGLGHPKPAKFTRMFDRYRETYAELSLDIDNLEDSAPDSAPLKAAARRADSEARDWWAVELEASRHVADDPDRAEAIYTEGIERMPDSVELLANYGDFLVRVREDQERATQLFERAYRIAPEHPSSVINYCSVLRYSGRLDEAERLYRQTLESDPGAYRVRVSLAYFLMVARGDHAAALRELEKRPNTSPRSSRMLSVMAQIYGHSSAPEHWRVAEALCRESVGLDPLNGNTWANLAEMQIAFHDDIAARESIVRARAHPVPILRHSMELELGLYELALERVAPQAPLISVRRLLEAGHRSVGWNFRPILERVRADAHPEAEWIERLAAVIADGENPAVLDGWNKWPSTSSDDEE